MIEAIFYFFLVLSERRSVSSECSYWEYLEFWLRKLMLLTEALVHKTLSTEHFYRSNLCKVGLVLVVPPELGMKVLNLEAMSNPILASKWKLNFFGQFWTRRNYSKWKMNFNWKELQVVYNIRPTKHKCICLHSLYICIQNIKKNKKIKYILLRPNFEQEGTRLEWTKLISKKQYGYFRHLRHISLCNCNISFDYLWFWFNPVIACIVCKTKRLLAEQTGKGTLRSWNFIRFTGWSDATILTLAKFIT